MTNLKRPFCRSAIRFQLPSIRPVHTFPKWDLLLATRFSSPDLAIAQIEQTAQKRFGELAAAGALDGAHAAILDPYIDELGAPLFESAENQLNDGIRIIELLNQQGLEYAKITCADAERLAREAQNAENEASAIYETRVGLEPITTGKIAPLNLEAEERRWDKQRLILESDQGILDFDSWGFRGMAKTSAKSTKIGEYSADDKPADNNLNSTPPLRTLHTIESGQEESHESIAAVKPITETITETATLKVNPVVFPWRTIGTGLLGLLGSFPDPLMLADVIDNVVGLRLFTKIGPDGKIIGTSGVSSTPLITLGIYLAVIAAAISAGAATAHARTSRQYPHYLIIIPLVAWTSMGIAMFSIRCAETKLTGGAAETDNYDWVMALVMFILYFLSGWCLYEASEAYLSSPWHLVHPSQKKAAKSFTAYAKASGLAIHVIDALNTNRLAASQWASEYQSHCIRLANALASIKDSMRLALATYLGNPGDTGLIYEPHRPTNVTE